MTYLSDLLMSRLVIVGDCLEFRLRNGKRPAGTGYGQLYDVPRRRRSAHVVAWESVNGPVPDGLCVLHTCDNRPCCRIDHLFLGTKGDNNRDATAKGRHGKYIPTHCPQGHEYTPANSLRYPSSGLKCRACRNAYRRRSRR